MAISETNNFLYSCAAVNKIPKLTKRRAVPLQQLSLLYRSVVVNGFKTDDNAITKFNAIKVGHCPQSYVMNLFGAEYTRV